jgi:Toprim domain
MTDAVSLTRSLRGRWYRRYGVAPCPICQPEGRKTQNALTLADALDGKLLAHCKKSGCSFSDLARAMGIAPGDFVRPDPVELARAAAQDRAGADKRARQALTLWNEALPITGTPAEAYLRGRGITCPLPETLRFHPAAWHACARRLPALVALVEGADRPAVHRTYLAPDGSAKAACEPAKAMLGAVAGGAVRLAGAPGRLVVAEGIETALSLPSGLLPGAMTLWAALSTSGLRALRLPSDPGALTIATDGEDAGRSAGQALAERAHARGWKVAMLHAPEGRDWNDVLTGKGGAA